MFNNLLGLCQNMSCGLLPRTICFTHILLLTIGFHVAGAMEHQIQPKKVELNIQHPSVEFYIPDPIENSLEPLPTETAPKEKAIEAPIDRCLPALYRDWSEASNYFANNPKYPRFVGARIIIDVQTFHLTLEGILGDGSPVIVYETEVGIGEPQSPTPEGEYVINHVYCYPDVMYFSGNHHKVPGLYKGFLAPLLICRKHGRCRRYRGIGIHGFEASAYPHPEEILHETYGQVSAGCIRLPDPCAFKTALVQTVRLGPVRKNERGTYHWLKTPIDVIVVNPEPVLVTIVRDGLGFLRNGIESILNGAPE